LSEFNREVEMKNKSINKSGLSDRANGKRSVPSKGPRSKAVGVTIANSKYPSRGTVNPVK